MGFLNSNTIYINTNTDSGLNIRPFIPYYIFKNNPEYTLAIFCDLSKAFDVKDHTILIQKLKCYGIRGIVNDWFANYLENRQQSVTI